MASKPKTHGLNPGTLTPVSGRYRNSKTKREVTSTKGKPLPPGPAGSTYTLLTERRIELSQSWALGEQIGAGGFGQVFAAETSDQRAVIKLIPKAPGAQRELLFVDLDGVPNVVPIIDSGETDDHWVLVMPRAEESLREHLQRVGGTLPVHDAVSILKDICDALVALAGNVVHRDLKPENVLLLNGAWCLSDFGISRYEEATTAPDTQKYALSAPYAAPERWRHERATSATDIYALGVIAYELIVGHTPFVGGNLAEFRDQHLHTEPPLLEGVPTPLSAIVDECLFKALEARPSPSNLRQRLSQVAEPIDSPGLSRLQEVNLAATRQKGEEARARSAARSESEQRSALADAAERSFVRISEQLKTALTAAAPSATLTERPRGGWQLQLGSASLIVGSMERNVKEGWGRYEPPAFDVVGVSSLNLRIPRDRHGYEGRSHSLWYCDAVVADQFSWFETAFMVSPLMPKSSPQVPFALPPNEDAAIALGNSIAELQVAWPFMALAPGELEDFVDRWAAWFATAADGQLRHPSKLPEHPPNGS